MFSIAGMLLFPAANDLLTMFIALEVLSLPLYLLCSLAAAAGCCRRKRTEVLPARVVLLAFFLYGVALLYGYAGERQHPAESRTRPALAAATRTCLLLGIALCAVGLLFKAGAVPFHFWTPDVYQGAPTPITGLHGGLHQGRRVRRAAAAVLRRARAGLAGTGSR
jgi:NADH-quinone oxidoreductase subunit N